MHRIIIAAIAALAVGCAVALTSAALAGSSPAVPVAEWPELTFTFDPVVDGLAVDHEFVVVNRGQADLQVQRVKTP